MSEETVKEKAGRFLASQKVKLVGFGLVGASLAASVSAIDINGSVGPIIDGVVSLIPSLTALVMGLIPLMIVVAVAKFFPQLFDSILGWMKM